MTRYQDRLLMSTLDRVLAWLDGIKSDEAKAKVLTLLNGYSAMFADVLDRKIKYRERTVFFDVDRPDPLIYLPAWPIGTDNGTGIPLVEIYNDSGLTPTYSTALTYPSDYRVYQTEDGQGRIEFIRELLEGPQALKVIFTGGMAASTIGPTGTAGKCSTYPGPPSLFLDTGAAFIDDGVKVGMSLVITDNKNGNAGTYIIDSVLSNSSLLFTLTAWPGGVGPADEIYEIPEIGLVSEYPDLEKALITQVVFHWKQRDKLDLKGMSVAGGAGMDTTFTQFKPLELLPTVETALDGLKRFIY